MVLGVGFWQSVINGYAALDSFPNDLHGRRLYEQNDNLVDALLDGLKNYEFIKAL